LGAAFVCTVAHLLFFWDAVTFQSTFYLVDVGLIDHPLRVHAARSMLSGEFPLWSASLLGGYPLFAENQTGVLYPPSWIYLLLPDHRGLNLFVVGHYLLASYSMIYLLREYRLPGWAALIGAISFSGSSFMLTEHIIPIVVAIMALTPLLLVFTRRLALHGTPGSALGMGVVIGLQTLAGNPLASVIVWAGVAIYFTLTTLLAGPSKGAIGLKLAGVVSAALVGAGLSAPQWYTTLEFFGQSTRSGANTWPTISSGLADPICGITAFLPRFFGEPPGPLWDRSVCPGWEENHFWFIGFGLVVFLPFVFRLARAQAAPLFVILGAGIALGTGVLGEAVTRAVYETANLTIFRWPARWFMLVSLASSMLIAFAARRAIALPVSRLLRRITVGWWVVALAGCLVMVVSGAALLTPASVHSLMMSEPLEALRRQDLLLLLTGVPLLAALLMGRWWGHLSTGSAGWFSAIAVVGLVLLPQASRRLVPTDFYSQPPSVLPREARNTQASGNSPRVLIPVGWSTQDEPGARGKDPAPGANQHLLHGINATDVFDVYATTTLERSQRLLRFGGRAALDLLGVEYVLLAEPERSFNMPGLFSSMHQQTVTQPARLRFKAQKNGLRLFKNPSAMPRAFVSYSWVIAPQTDERRRILTAPGFDPSRVTVLETSPGIRPRPGQPLVPARIEAYGHHRAVVRVTSPVPGLLVLSDTHYPGWHATVNGEAREILYAYDALRAVPVPRGESTVVFTYSSARFRQGFLWGGLVLGLGLVLLVIIRRWPRRAA